MTQPLLPWEYEYIKNTSRPSLGLIWRDKLDDRYLIEVCRINDYHGKLYVYDHNKNDKEIACWDVGLSYGAMFGPDVADVDKWQKKVLDFIDNTYNH